MRLVEDRAQRAGAGLLWIYFGLIMALVGGRLMCGWTLPGEPPVQLIDWLAYRDAAHAVAQGTSPYGTPAQNAHAWTGFHARERELGTAAAQGRGKAMLKEQNFRLLSAPPYLYPPTLALLFQLVGMTRPVWAALVLLSVAAFTVGWLRLTHAPTAWLLVVLGSVDLLSSVMSGNVEVVLLALALVTAWALWHDHPLLAALPLALVLAVKPFYVLLFGSLAVLLLLCPPTTQRRALRTLLLAGGSAALLVALDAAHWGPGLWAAYRSFLHDGATQLWLVLPRAQQTPLSMWNRTPTQGLVNAGVAPSVALVLGPLLAGGCLARTLWRVRDHHLGLPLTFALALVIVYLGRPVGWGLLYLDLVVPVAVWPWQSRRERNWLLLALLVFSGSHLVAYTLTLQGQGLGMLTLQSARWPVETWLVLPAAWWLLLRAVARTPVVRVPPVPRRSAPPEFLPPKRTTRPAQPA